MRNGLRVEFERIKDGHRQACKARVAREVLGSSVIRVFRKNTKPALFETLLGLPVDGLTKIRSSRRFRLWYERQLECVAEEVRKSNSKNPRVMPGLKWGHSSKVLSLYLRDLVMHTRYFEDEDARRIENWLFVPIDSFVIKRLRKLGIRLPFKSIREINSSAKFYFVQELLENTGAQTNIPPVWFDDNWADRQGSH